MIEPQDVSAVIMKVLLLTTIYTLHKCYNKLPANTSVIDNYMYRGLTVGFLVLLHLTVWVKDAATKAHV